jgi:hypothetical protein
MTSITHLAGPAITWDGRYVRQRCSWCGAILIDLDMERVMVPVADRDRGVATWPFESFVRVDGPMSSTVDAQPSAQDPGATRVPPDCCMRLDPRVTA